VSYFSAAGWGQTQGGVCSLGEVEAKTAKQQSSNQSAKDHRTMLFAF